MSQTEASNPQSVQRLSAEERVAEPQVEMPNFDLSTLFPFIDGMQCRLTPIQSVYLLDFTSADGHTRIDVLPSYLQLWDLSGGGAVYLPPPGSFLKFNNRPVKTPWWFINTYGAYEIRDGRDGHVMKTIKFPASVRLVVE